PRSARWAARRGESTRSHAPRGIGALLRARDRAQGRAPDPDASVDREDPFRARTLGLRLRGTTLAPPAAAARARDRAPPRQLRLAPAARPAWRRQDAPRRRTRPRGDPRRLQRALRDGTHAGGPAAQGGARAPARGAARALD